MEFENIIVAVDFSEHSDRALDAALGMAKRDQATLHLVHSFHIPMPGPTPDAVLFPPDTWASVREASAQKLERILERMKAEGIECELHLCPGYPVGAILDTAEEVEADLIVMGTRGLSGLKHVLLGSVAERTIRVAPCPVLTVR